MSDKVCCFPIPSGGKTIAIIEFVFIGIGGIAVILGFLGGSIAGSVINLLFLIGLGVCAYFLMKAHPENKDGYALPFAIVKIIHVVFQGIWLIWVIVGIAGVSAVAAYDDQRGYNGAAYGIVIGSLVFFLIFTATWFILGIFGIVVAFKVRSWIRANNLGGGHPGGVVIQQPGYPQPPPAYQPPPK